MGRRLKRKYRRMLWGICAVAVALVVASKVNFSCASCSHAEADAQDTVGYKHLNETLTNAMSDCDSIAEMDSLIKRYLRRWELDGAQVAISRHDSLLYCKGFGWADKRKREAMTPRHIMRVASVSKLVTAVGIMKMQEMGLLRLTDKVFGPGGLLNDTTYTNSIRDTLYYSITVEHLLRHEAGFTTRAGDPMFSTRFIMMQNHLDTPPDHTTLLKILLRRRLGFVPGTARWYSNLGYTLLSLIMEQRSGLDYETFMRRHVLEPAGCYDFHIGGTYYGDRRENEVRYHMHGGSEPVYEYNNSGRKVEKCYGDNDLPRLLGAGAWVASAAELSRLIASIDGQPEVRDILSRESVEAMTEERPDNAFSLGWNRTPKNGTWIRTGSLAGTSALVLKYADGECWILITNTSTRRRI